MGTRLFDWIWPSLRRNLKLSSAILLVLVCSKYGLGPGLGRSSVGDTFYSPTTQRQRLAKRRDILYRLASKPAQIAPAGGLLGYTSTALPAIESRYRRWRIFVACA